MQIAAILKAKCTRINEVINNMTEYSLTEKQDGTIEFWTNDEELRLRIEQYIKDLADAISYRREIVRKYNEVTE